MLDAEDVAPGAVQATPRPPMPKANQLEAKKARLQRWEKDPSLIEKEIGQQREALKRAQKEDLQVNSRLRGFMSMGCSRSGEGGEEAGFATPDLNCDYCREGEEGRS